MVQRIVVFRINLSMRFASMHEWRAIALNCLLLWSSPCQGFHAVQFFSVANLIPINCRTFPQPPAAELTRALHLIHYSIDTDSRPGKQSSSMLWRVNCL